MRKIMPFLIVVAIIIPFSPWEDTHWPKWMMFHFIAAILLGIKYADKYSWPIGLAMFTTIFSGAQIICNRDTYVGMNPILRIDMSNMAGKAVVSFLLMILLAENFSYKTLRGLLKSYFWVCTLHCIYVLTQLFYFKIEPMRATGFLPNISMGPSMLAVLYPLVIHMSDGSRAYELMRKFALVLFPIVIVCEGSSIAWAALVAGISVYAFQVIKIVFRFRVAVLVLIAVALVGVVLGPYVDSNFTRKISRYVFWPHILKEWYENASLLFGAGTGSFRHLGPNMQQKINFEMGQWWYWAHNDWLQVLFETGIFGLISALAIWVQGVKRSYQALDLGLCASLVALGVVGFGNYFLRLAEFCFLVTILLAIPLKYYGEHGSNKRMVPGN